VCVYVCVCACEFPVFFLPEMVNKFEYKPAGGIAMPGGLTGKWRTYDKSEKKFRI